MAVAAADQTALDERIVDDTDLEASLEAREAAKEKAAFARKAYKEKDDQAKGAIEALGLEEGDACRVGRFRVERVAVALRSVSFETDPSSRLKIQSVDDA